MWGGVFLFQDMVKKNGKINFSVQWFYRFEKKM